MRKQEARKLTLVRETLRALEVMDLEKVKGGLADAGRISSDNKDCTYSRVCSE